MSAAIIQTEFLFMTPAEHFGPYVDVLYMSQIDAKAQINQNPFGILQENLDPVDAERLHEGFKAVKINTIIVPQEQVNQLELIQMRNASIADAITSEDMYGKEVHYEYGGIGAVSITIDPQMVKRSLHEREYFLDIIYKDGRVLRINSKKFNYRYLGPRITQHSVTNFFMLVDDLNSHLGAVYKDDGFNQTVNKYVEDINGFKDILSLKRYLRWLSHMHLIGFETNSATADGSRAPRESVFSKIRDENEDQTQQETPAAQEEETQKSVRPSIFAKKEEPAPVQEEEFTQKAPRPSVFAKKEEPQQQPTITPKPQQPVLKVKQDQPTNAHNPSIFSQPAAAPQGNEEETQKSVRPSIFAKKEEPQQQPTLTPKPQQPQQPVLKVKQDQPTNAHNPSIFSQPAAAPKGNEEETQKSVRPSVFAKKEETADNGSEDETTKAPRPSVFGNSSSAEPQVQPPAPQDPNTPPVLQVKRERLGEEKTTRPSAFSNTTAEQPAPAEKTSRPSVFGSNSSSEEKKSLFGGKGVKENEDQPKESVFGNKGSGLFGGAKESSSSDSSGSQLGKRIKGAHKALIGGKDPEMVISSMTKKGVPNKEARFIVEVLWKLYEMDEVMGVNDQNGPAILNKMNVKPQDQILFLQIFKVKGSDTNNKKKGWFKK